MVLRGGRQNARRINSVGLPLQRYQLTAYVLSAIPCGIAGMLLAKHYVMEKGVVVWSGDSAGLRANARIVHEYLGV